MGTIPRRLVWYMRKDDTPRSKFVSDFEFEELELTVKASGLFHYGVTKEASINDSSGIDPFTRVT